MDNTNSNRGAITKIIIGVISTIIGINPILLLINLTIADWRVTGLTAEYILPWAFFLIVGIGLMANGLGDLSLRNEQQ